MDIPDDFETPVGWHEALNARHEYQASPAVYVIVVERPICCLHGWSEIVYIGSTGEFGGSGDSCRLRAYRYPGGDHARRMKKRVGIL